MTASLQGGLGRLAATAIATESGAPTPPGSRCHSQPSATAPTKKGCLPKLRLDRTGKFEGFTCREVEVELSGRLSCDASDGPGELGLHPAPPASPCPRPALPPTSACCRLVVHGRDGSLRSCESICRCDEKLRDSKQSRELRHIHKDAPSIPSGRRGLLMSTNRPPDERSVVQRRMRLRKRQSSSRLAM